MNAIGSATDRLALHGGPAVCPSGPPPWPPPDDEVLDALRAAWTDGTWGVYQGRHTAALEAAVRDLWAVEHVVLCGSGTYAVELAWRALRIGPGDEVLMAAYDFPGNFLSVHAVGALPVLVDVAADNWNLAIEQLDVAYSPAVRALLVSHLHGGLVAMRQVMDWARQRRVAVVEDAAQCPGAVVQGRPVGTWGDIGILSFGGSKLLTAGRGGAVITNRADAAQRARTHQLRGNVVCPLSELQAAVLLPQLRRLKERNRRRRANVARLLEALGGVPGLRPLAARDGDEPGFYKLGFHYEAEAFGLPREQFLAAVGAEGIALGAGFAAAHVGRSPRRYRRGSDLTEAERAHHGCVVLHHPVLLGEPPAVMQVAEAIRKVYRHRASLSSSLQGRLRQATSSASDRMTNG
ncbi:MAG: aminotransferase class V-fold PLP-dependent enzyme [Gemmataceae bacterium]|nr:aminotransferase class V-fold PLP-dependent enzyme [Gemmataceae bacterium]